VTGRLASSDPNLQNIPVRSEEGRRIRTAFIAPAGSRSSADYSQIELRIMAHLSGDERLLDAFAHGEDAQGHRRRNLRRHTARSRPRAAPRRQEHQLRPDLRHERLRPGPPAGLERSAATYIDRYFARYPGVARYMEEARKRRASQGYVETVFGRRLWLPEIRSSNGNRRQAPSAPRSTRRCRAPPPT
jgi:DNA polymerase-1